MRDEIVRARPLCYRRLARDDESGQEIAEMRLRATPRHRGNIVPGHNVQCSCTVYTHIRHRRTRISLSLSVLLERMLYLGVVYQMLEFCEPLKSLLKSTPLESGVFLCGQSTRSQYFKFISNNLPQFGKKDRFFMFYIDISRSCI